jgi:putative addiction module component (TIGR02574 family)
LLRAYFWPTIQGMVAEKIPGLKKLSLQEKLILAAELWNEVAAQPNSLPPRKDHIRLLKKRLKHYSTNPKDCVPWDDVRRRVLGSR